MRNISIMLHLFSCHHNGKCESAKVSYGVGYEELTSSCHLHFNIETIINWHIKWLDLFFLNVLQASYTRENRSIKKAVRMTKHKINGWDQLSMENEPYSMKENFMWFSTKKIRKTKKLQEYFIELTT